MKYMAFHGAKNGDFAACLKKFSKYVCYWIYEIQTFGSRSTSVLYTGWAVCKMALSLTQRQFQ